MDRNHRLMLISLLTLCGIGCGPAGVKPVDLYPEDECAHCRMAISDPHFACEIVAANGDAFKFDDIGCLEAFLNEKPQGLTVAGTFYKDYPTAAWLPSAEATVVETGIMTPMGSGKLAFAGKTQAEEFRKQHPPSHRAPQQSSL